MNTRAMLKAMLSKLLPVLCALVLSGARAQTPAACTDLRRLTDGSLSVSTAKLVAASGKVPAYCHVAGQILPEVQFEVSLPHSWNGRFYLFGNGGFAGEPFDVPYRLAQRQHALELGYAVAATDTGHDAAREPLATFAVNRQKLLDYAFRAVHVTAVAAKQLIGVYYGRAPQHAYFDGCSTGGRQGLILAQRFPQDFDGILVGAPVLNFTGTMLAATAVAQALATTPIPPAKLPLLAERIYQACDRADGLADGLIADPRRGGFQPGRDLPVCGNDGKDAACFSPAEITTLAKIYGPVLSQGRTVFPGWPVGAEIAGGNGRSGWQNWIVNAQGPTIAASFAESFFRYIAWPRSSPLSPSPVYPSSGTRHGSALHTSYSTQPMRICRVFGSGAASC